MGRKIGESIDVSEADANALVAQQIAPPVSEDLITPAIQKAMEQAFAGFQKGLDAVINAQLTAFQNAQTKSRSNAVPGKIGDIHGCFPPLRRGREKPCYARSSSSRPYSGREFSTPVTC
jgi:hypothetical protein